MNDNKTTPREAQLHDAVDLIIRTRRLHHKIVERRIDGIGVHHSQHRMLMELAHMGKTNSQKDIAAKLGVSPACVARTLKCLSAGDLIEKADGADGRCNEINITPHGQQVVKDSMNLFHETDAQMFDSISPEDVALMIRMFKRIQSNLLGMEQADANCERSE